LSEVSKLFTERTSRASRQLVACVEKLKGEGGVQKRGRIELSLSLSLSPSLVRARARVNVA
jgi:hypothetical protein